MSLAKQVRRLGAALAAASITNNAVPHFVPDGLPRRVVAVCVLNDQSHTYSENKIQHALTYVEETFVEHVGLRVTEFGTFKGDERLPEYRKGNHVTDPGESCTLPYSVVLAFSDRKVPRPTGGRRAGQWSGNTAIVFATNKYAAVAAHEIGHALGLGHSDDTTSIMAPMVDAAYRWSEDMTVGMTKQRTQVFYGRHNRFSRNTVAAAGD